MPSLPKRLSSDEEIITRAIKAAFPRPGPWLPNLYLKINDVWKPGAGEVWEVFTASIAAATLLNREIQWAPLTAGQWLPIQGFVNPWAATQWTATGAVYDVTGEMQVEVFYSAGTEGWIFGDNDILSVVGGECFLRMRRRFDLE